MITKTGFGYLQNSAGQILHKFVLSIGAHPSSDDALIAVDVADENALNAIVIYKEPLTSVQSFNIDFFVQSLLTTFAGDNGVLQYYAAIKDLALYKDFAGMNTLINALLAAGKLTQTEVTDLTSVLAQQGIVLSTFTS